VPSVINSPVNSGIVNQSTTIFDYPDTPATSLLSLQAAASQPLPAELPTATGQLTPDQVLQLRLSNFPESYSLTPGSHLMNLMQAFLGPSGVGQVRTRNTLAILQTALSSTHFYDLDSFYGAIFGALRGPDGSLPVNQATGSQVSPYTDLVTQDGADELAAIDAKFRERIIALARGIALGATIPGMQAMAQALTGVECDVYPVWALIEAQGLQIPGNTWLSVRTAHPAWNDFGGLTWYDVPGAVTFSFGGMGINALNEIVVQPRKTYDLTSAAGRLEYSQDMYGIQRVLEVLKPAGTLLTVSAQGTEVNQQIAPSSLYSPDDSWSISARVQPAPGSQAYTEILEGYDPAGPVAPGAPSPVPSPVLSGTEGGSWSYAPLVSEVQALCTQNQQYGTVISVQDFETIQFPGAAKYLLSWFPGWAVILPSQAASAQAASSAVSAPYSGPRVPVMNAA
jgi:hypothetical protein